MALDQLFKDFWQLYVGLNPQATKIHQLIEEKGDKVVNDHVAFRTIKSESIGIPAHIEHFKQFGYTPKGEYHFEAKKLYAVHLEHEDPVQPKLFVSELLVDQFSPNVRNAMNNILSACQGKEFTDIFNHGRSWSANHKTYRELSEESEYASWLYIHGLCVNHFTVFLNALNSFNEISDINTWLKEQGFSLNSSGGEIKGSKEAMLEQSSTLSSIVKVQLDDGEFEVPGCYYEFAKRYKDSSGELFQGFVAKSADKIFESTDIQKSSNER